ncbi:unnamed protein product [Peronospora belbahrii]|uniref:EF-hand domain-containing protein n=1 Tax=Peronospora belbahrii TaxID=622444 RepID=A0AAU9L895_9STRA|nr:unnamed protein product [Peronospora belbahrii]
MAGKLLFQVGKDVEFWRVLVHLSILAFVLVLAEGALHRLEHKFPPSGKYQHMLKKAYRELMVLGLISLGLKFVKEIPEIDGSSKTMLAFQVADLTIFLLALALILQSTGVFLLLRNQNHRAERAELITTQDLVHLVDISDGLEDSSVSFLQKYVCCGRAAKAKANSRELIELRLLRRLFLYRFGLPQLFPFSKHLSRAQANQIEYMIETFDAATPESHELVEALMMFAWTLLLLHVMVFLFFRSCVYHFLSAAAFSHDKDTLMANFSTIADEEAEAWNNEDAEEALETMSYIQEHHEELEFQRCRNEDDSNHQCAFYDMDEIYEDFGTLPAVMVPLPLVINSLILQRHIFYDFVIISSTLCTDSHMLSDVVENFSDVVRLRSEFATTLLNHITQQEKTVFDLQEELKTRDRNDTGFIEVDNLRSLLVFYVAWQLVDGQLDPSANNLYTIVNRIDENDSVVAIVRLDKVLFLLYDESIIGAEFEDPNIRDQTAFPGFTIMQCAAYLTTKPTRAMQIGLGIGTVPSFLRKMDIPTDVVEISEAVVTQATDYFQYQWCPWYQKEDDEDDEEECRHGRTFVMDGLKFLSSKPIDLGIQTDHDQADLQPYDLFIVDVYTGFNPFLFFVRDQILRIRDNWLISNGVLVMNFVGYIEGFRAQAPKSIYRTLQSVFQYVKCFRELEEVIHDEAANIIFYASDKPFSFNLPTTEMYENPEKDTFFSVVTNFPNWEIFTDLKTQVEVAIHQDSDDEGVRFMASNERSQREGTDAVRVLTEADHGQEDFRQIHADTQVYMRQRVLDQFPSALWEELKQRPDATT